MDAEAQKVELRKVVLPIIVEDEAGRASVLGTGFITLANGRQAHLVTAAHVMKWARQIERPRDRHHPTAYFVPVEYRFELERTTPFAVYQHPTRGACRVTIEAFLELPDADLALCSIRFGEAVSPDVRFDAQFILDSRPVQPGEQIVALGYAKGEVEVLSGDDVGAPWTFSGKWIHRPGIVTEVFAQGGPRGQKAACFQSTANFDAGMSGGPVIAEDPDGGIVVRGAVMSDLETHQQGGDPAALATAIWQLYLFPVSPPDAQGYIGGRTLLDLEREGVIADRGRGSDHVAVERSDNGQVRSAHWA